MSLAKLLLVSSVFLGVGGACGAVPDDGTDGPTDGAMDAKPPPPPGTTVYQGTLAMSAPAPFGMLPDTCEYTMTLRQIELEVQLSTTGTITAATVQNLTDEKIVGSCPYTPAEPTIQKFKLKSATPVGTSTMLVMEGLATNTPVASLSITLVLSGGAFNATARWTRTDQAPVFNWMVTANLTLTAK